MATIQSDDIKFYYSGGSSNSDGDDSIGGVKSSEEIPDGELHNLFDKIDAEEAEADYTDYRGIYVANENGESLNLESVLAFIDEQDTDSDVTIKIGLPEEGVDEEIESLADEETEPTDVTFDSADGEDNGLDLVDSLSDGSYIGLWIERTSPTESSAYGDDYGKIGIRGETTST